MVYELLWTGMPKNPEDTQVPAHLSEDELRDFVAIAAPRDWSKKKLAEHIIRGFMKLDTKQQDHILLLGRKGR